MFQVKAIEEHSIPRLGYAPELPQEQQGLREIRWKLIKEMQEDKQVSEVIKALGLKV